MHNTFWKGIKKEVDEMVGASGRVKPSATRQHSHAESFTRKRIKKSLSAGWEGVGSWRNSRNGLFLGQYEER